MNSEQRSGSFSNVQAFIFTRLMAVHTCWAAPPESPRAMLAPLEYESFVEHA